MNLERAAKLMDECADRMNAAYGNPVFDEWALISLDEAKAKVLAYRGPRKEEFQKNLAADLGMLRSELLGGKHEVGEFEFARGATGTRIEAFLAAGADVYLLCNNTTLSMEQIATEPKWLQAQAHFAKLAEEFYKDPVFHI
jgi:hypothetical protein